MIEVAFVKLPLPVIFLLLKVGMFVKFVQISTTIYLIVTFQVRVGPLNLWFMGHLIMWFKGPINSHSYILDLQVPTCNIY